MTPTELRHLKILLPLALLGAGVLGIRGIYGAKMARENAEQTRVEREKQAALDAEELARKVATMKAKEDAERAKRAPAERPALDPRLVAMTPTQRMAAMNEICTPRSCDSKEAGYIIFAGATEAEKNALRTAYKKSYDIVAADSRQMYAAGLNTALSQKQLSPDAIEARGPTKTILHIKGSFCSGQTLRELRFSNIGKDADTLGFKKMECEGPGDVWTRDL